jgi:transglutaminase-like putative cysteine protease
MREFLEPTSILDSDHPEILAFAEAEGGVGGDPRETAIRLYYAVRDGIRYDPYNAGTDAESLRASSVLRAGRGWCVSKAVLLSAACRARGIPARLGFADVRNHLSTERLRRRMKTDVFYYHGYSSIRLDDRWLKATPAFNIELCEKFRLLPLEFDGKQDSIYHAFDADGRQHMEYVRDRGEYADVPLEELQRTLREKYPAIDFANEGADFEQDVENETRAS